MKRLVCEFICSATYWVQFKNTNAIKKEPIMIEATTSNTARDAMQSAHEARGQVLRDAWHWLFSASGSR